MKKITKNNKGFSLIELIIVIAIMAVLVAIIAPNLSKYLGSSKKNTDKKNADEIASQIQTCISDFESSQDATGSDYGYVYKTGTITLTWNSSGCTSAGSSNDTDFAKMLNDSITNSTQSKEDKTKYATATIDLKGTSPAEGYKIIVTINNQSVSR